MLLTSVRSVSGRTRTRISLVAVFVIAAGLRLLMITTSSGGLHGIFNYDASVYYAAADGLVHGQLPYSDYILVHPPLIAILLTPFAVFGRLTTAASGFAAANLAMLVLGSVNAALIVPLCRRLGLRLPAAVLGALFYAVWFGSVQAEFLARLEPLGNFFFLLFLLVAPAPSVAVAGRTRLFWWGVLGAATCLVKLWWALPVALVVLWYVTARRRPVALLPVLGGGLTATVLVLGPFAAADPGATLRMIVSSQLGRVRTHGGPGRFVQLYSVARVGDHPLRTIGAVLVLALVVVLGAAVFAAAWRARPARVFVVVLAAQLLLLYRSPAFFAYYADYLTVPAAVVVAAAYGGVRGRLRVAGPSLAAMPVVVALAATVTFFGRGGPGLVFPFADSARMAAAARPYQCITSDSPMMLIELDALDRSFTNGCHNWVDVTAGVLGVYAPADRATARRYFQPSLTRRLDRYLTSGDAVIIMRTVPFGMSPATGARIRGLPVVVRSGPYVLHRLH